MPLVLSLAVGAHAQTAAPAKAEGKPDAKADPKADEATAAMERAKRQAAGPMRVILEASKGKRREGEPAAAPPVNESASVRTVATRGAPAAEITPRAVLAPPPAAAEPVPAPAPAVAAPVSNPVSTQITLSSESLQGHRVGTVPGLERATSAVAPSLPSSPSLSAKVVDLTVKPKLVSRVDPDVPQRVLDDMGRNAVVLVDLSLRANGTVANVAMVTAVPGRMQRVLSAALEQWRFDPLPSDRVHRIELVFNGE
jgi:hypothetical protein